MFQTRIHGRGGQGVVTAAELMSVAAFAAGKHAQAFPSFGSERTGAPVVAYCRIDESPIRNREPVVVPDGLIIQDATLLNQVDLFSGLSDDAFILINTKRTLPELGMAEFVAERRLDHVITVPATEIAMRWLGKPVPNAVLLGGFAALTGVVSLTGVQRAVCERFPGELGQSNAAAAAEAHQCVLEVICERGNVGGARATAN